MVFYQRLRTYALYLNPGRDRLRVTVERMMKISDIARFCLLAANGVVLYVPAAVGLLVAEIWRRPEPEDDRWRYVLPSREQCLSTTAKKTDLWAHMNFNQYFSLIPGATALTSEKCAFSRPSYSYGGAVAKCMAYAWPEEPIAAYD
jgi:hypothetical protein